MTDEAKLILEKLDKMDTRITNLETSMNAKFESIDARFESMDAKFESMDAKISDLQLTLENETNHNIRLIAEGHLDLSRKLDEALKVENEKEMLMIRVTTMENEIRKINSKLEDIA